MKKFVCLLLVCSYTGIAFALQTTLHKLPPTMDNPSIRKSERAQSNQTRQFQSRRGYASMKRHGSNRSQRQQSKSQSQGKGL